MQVIYTDKAPKPIGTYSQAIKINNMVYLSGQIGIDCTTMELCSDNIEEQINQTMLNLQEICFAAQGELANIVKLNVYLTDVTNSHLINKLMEKYFLDSYPARAIVEVSQLPKGAKVEIEAVMALK